MKKKSTGYAIIPFSKIFIPFCVFTFFCVAVYAQSSKPPLPTGSYTNSVNFDFTLKKFLFNFYGSDTITYEYKPTNRGTLNPLKCINGPYAFNASNDGGLCMEVGGTTIYPWSTGVTFALKSLASSGDTLSARWRMSYASDSLVYTYRFFISGRTLTIGLAEETGNTSFYGFDRCSNAIAPQVVPVPYLTLFNVLYTNNLFASLYTDWEKTAASDIQGVNYIASSTSVAYAQNMTYTKLTNGKRNKVNETIYLTVSPKINDVFPTLSNPVSTLKNVSSGRMIYDFWGGTFSGSWTVISQLRNAGIHNLWYIKHTWQNAGFDNKYPDIMPADSARGGDTALKRLGDSLAANNFLFSLHENYIDMYPNAPSWNPANLALTSTGALKPSWYNSATGIQAILIKPTKSLYYSSIFSPAIHTAYGTSASYSDGMASVSPGRDFDCDTAVADAGKYTGVLNRYRVALSAMRGFHNGPVTSEGLHHFLYAGYIDDAEHQINSGSPGYWSAMRMPLLVDFQLQKVHPLMCAHGVGYYERFFSDTLNRPVSMVFNFDSTLVYAATELAYGNGSFIPGGQVTNLVKVAQLEQKHVFSAQQFYANATPVSVMYNDNGTLLDASDYIKRYPAGFKNRSDSNFMAQVKITYNNGMIVCVNRNMYKPWQVNIGSAGGWFNYHATINSIDSLNTGTSDSTRYLLPARSGWAIYMPQPALKLKNAEVQQPLAANTTGISIWPVPSSGTINIKMPDTLTRRAKLFFTLTDMWGKVILSKPLSSGMQSFTVPFSGVYVGTVTRDNESIFTRKVIIIK